MCLSKPLSVALCQPPTNRSCSVATGGDVHTIEQEATPNPTFALCDAVSLAPVIPYQVLENRDVSGDVLERLLGPNWHEVRETPFKLPGIGVT